MPMFDVRDLTKPRPGFLYEPRVLWGAGLITQVEDPNTGVVTVDVQGPGRDDYYNGSRWPIVLTDVITLVQSPAGQVATGGSILDQIPIELGALGGARYSFGKVSGLVEPAPSRESLEGVSVIDYDAVPFQSLGFDPITYAQPTVRSVQNLTRWDFEHTLKLPPAAFIDFELSGRVPTGINTANVAVEADVNFYADAPTQRANWPGSALTRSRFGIGQLTIPTAQFYYQAIRNSAATDGGTPFPFNTLPFQSFAGGPLTQLYPPAQKFTSRDAVQQKATYNTPTQLHGFSVAFDQNTLDRTLAAGGGLTGPLSTTTYSRVRTRNGGTGTYWWRDGAPLAICAPTMTPATVSRLSRPLALQPGEGFKLTLPAALAADPSLRLPLAGLIIPPVGDPLRICQAVFYISFTGYANVEA